MNKKRRRNKRLKAITAAAFMGIVVSACFFDGDKILGAVIVNGVCLLWLALVAAANAR